MTGQTLLICGYKPLSLPLLSKSERLFLDRPRSDGSDENWTKGRSHRE